jgi:hypothetical protein
MAATDRLDGVSRIKPSVRRLGRGMGFALLAIGILLIGARCSAAIWYRCPGGEAVRGLVAAANLIFAVAVLAWISTDQNPANAIPAAMAGSQMNRAHGVMLVLYNLVRR